MCIENITYNIKVMALIFPNELVCPHAAGCQKISLSPQSALSLGNFTPRAKRLLINGELMRRLTPLLAVKESVRESYGTSHELTIDS